jgi:hypothetical protein
MRAGTVPVDAAPKGRAQGARTRTAGAREGLEQPPLLMVWTPPTPSRRLRILVPNNRLSGGAHDWIDDRYRHREAGFLGARH